jgi:2,3-bisphosphoglycerate-independent phosphoglycerate mutase
VLLYAESKYNDQYNAIHVATTPTMDALKAPAPRRWRLLKAHGTAVGLPTDGDMGNSEVGHNALGAGAVACSGGCLRGRPGSLAWSAP